MTTANYFKRHWEETTGDELTESWGHSTYYFETGEDFYVLRQLQVFANGKILKYDTSYTDDQYGGLSDVPHDIATFKAFRIDKTEFEQLWQILASNNLPV